MEKIDADAITGKIRGLIGELDGDIKKEVLSEKKKLAYPIKKQLYGYYVSVEFGLEKEKTAELEQQLKLDNNILRFLLVTQKEISARRLKTKIAKPKKIAPAEISKTEPKVEKVQIEELDKKLEELLKE